MLQNARQLRVYSPPSRLDNLLFNMSYFDQQGEVEEHQHTCIEIAICVGGSGEHYSGNSVCPLRRGMVCITLPGGSHGMRNCRHLRHYNISCSNELLQNIGFRPLFLHGVHMIFREKCKAVLLQMTPDEMKDVDGLLTRMYGIYQQENQFREGNMRFQFALLLCLFSQAYERGCLLGQTVEERVADMADYLQNHIQENLTLQKLCQKLSVSPSYLIRVFQRKYHVTPMEYVLRKRVELSRSYLDNTVMPIKEIAFRCGFASESYFSKFFRKRVGVCPEEYRLRKK